MFGFSFDKTMEEVKQELDAGKDIQLIDVPDSRQCSRACTDENSKKM